MQGMAGEWSIEMGNESYFVLSMADPLWDGPRPWQVDMVPTQEHSNTPVYKSELQRMQSAERLPKPQVNQKITEWKQHKSTCHSQYLDLGSSQIYSKKGLRRKL